MAKITPLFKTPEHEAQDMKDYKLKLFRHRAGRGMKILICAVVVLGIILGIGIYAWNKTYLGYETISAVERNDVLNTQYVEYNNKMLKYSRDGISCVNFKNEALWSQTYSMQTPIIDICQGSIVVADQQGNEVYVFNEQGFQTQITTLLPIQQVSISSQGVVALLLNGSDAAWISLYDNEGTNLTEAQCRLEETGQPLSISISPDGAKLAVSYLQVLSKTASSCIVFYNFGPIGGNFVDKIVASKVYEDTIIPRIKYLGDNTCVAVSDQSIIYYEGKEIPEEKAIAEIETEIRSLFFGEKTVGIVVEGAGKDSQKYEVRLFDTNGNQTLTQGTNLTYSQIKMSGENLILYSDNECEIYSKQGILRYTGTFDGTLANIYKGSGLRRYILVFSDRTEEIKLK